MAAGIFRFFLWFVLLTTQVGRASKSAKIRPFFGGFDPLETAVSAVQLLHIQRGLSKCRGCNHPPTLRQPFYG
jgi:hypothetical protein